MPLPMPNAPPETGNGPWDLLSGMLATADWTAEARAATGPLAVDLRRDAEDVPQFRRDDYDAIARALHRREQRHLLVTGRKGVGKTATIRELARRAAMGEIPFLIDRRFLWLDVSNVGPEDSRACLETIAAVASSPPSEPIEFSVDEHEHLGDTLNRVFQNAFERAEQQDQPEVVL